MADVRKGRIPLLWSTVRERAWPKPKVLVLTWRIRSINLSAEEQSCLEGVSTMRKGQRDSQRRGCDR